MSHFNSSKTHCKHGHEFNSENTYRDNKNRRYCKLCRSRWAKDNIGKKRIYYKKWYDKWSKVPNNVWNKTIRSNYGITSDNYREIYEKQEGRCAICRNDIKFRTKYTHIDHNHHTGKVRGLLCNKCNTGLGKFNDDLKILQSALDYIKND